MDNFQKALYKHTGEKIRRARMMKGMSQTDLAKAMGYSDSSTIYKIEKGLQKMPNAKIQQLCYILGIDSLYLSDGFDYRVTTEGGHGFQIENIDTRRDGLISEGMNYLYNATPDDLEKIVGILRVMVGGKEDGETNMER